MNKILNFFLSKEDQDRIVDTTITIEDIKKDGSNVPDELQSGIWSDQSLLIKFQISDPSNGAPKLLSLFPSYQDFKFLYDTSLNTGKKIPSRLEIDPNLSNFDNWATKGTIKAVNTDRNIIVKMLEKKIVVPNTIWVYPVQLTKSFLFNQNQTLLFNGTIINPEYSEYFSMLIHYFLAGRNTFSKKPIAPESFVEMPTVLMKSDGWIEVIVTMASKGYPQDKESFAPYHLKDNITVDYPSYAGNALIPSRYIFNEFMDSMNYSDGKLAKKIIEDNVLNGYHILQFTRTAKLIPNFSFFFPGQTIEITKSDGTHDIVWKGRLPAHGVIFISKNKLNGETNVKVKKISTHPHVSPSLEMSMLKGSSECWKEMGSMNNDITVNLDPSPPQNEEYIVLRLRMKDAVFLEEENLDFMNVLECNKNNFIHVLFSGSTNACTHFSLRRVVRTLIDNRICGGKLIKESNYTSESTKKLLRETIGNNNLSKIINKHPMLPSNLNDVTSKSSQLRDLLKILFPKKVNFDIITANNNTIKKPNKGLIAYLLWQSSWITNLPQAHVGNGAAGALVYLGLAEYIIDPTNFLNFINGSYDYEGIVADIINKLPNIEKGAMIQLWKYGQIYAAIRAGKKKEDIPNIIDDADNTFLGHSFMLYSKEYFGEKPFNAVDQHGCAPVVFTENFKRLKYRGTFERSDIWIIANWIE